MLADSTRQTGPPVLVRGVAPGIARPAITDRIRRISMGPSAVTFRAAYHETIMIKVA